MSTTKVNPQMFTPGTQTPNSSLENNVVTSSKIVDNSIINADISPSAAIDRSKLSLPGNANEAFGAVSGFTEVDLSAAGTNAFNIGLLGFKMAVNEGLTRFNLVDGVVDEFNDESGIDTSENTNALYDSSSDFYSNLDGPNPFPGPTAPRQSFTTVGPATYSVPALTTSVDVLVIGGGGAGANTNQYTQSAGGGAGGLTYLTNQPVPAGGTVSVYVGSGGGLNPMNNPQLSWTAIDGVNYSGTTPFSGHVYAGEDSSFGPIGPAGTIVGEGGGRGDAYSNPYGAASPTATWYETNTRWNHGGSGGGAAQYPTNAGGESTQNDNHPVTPFGLPEPAGHPGGIPEEGTVPTPVRGTVNLAGTYGTDGGPAQASGGANNAQSSAGGGAAEPGGEAAGGDGLQYNIADGSTAVYYAGGGSAVPEANEPLGGGGTSNVYNGDADPGTVNTGSGGGGGAANYNDPSYSLKGRGGYGGSGIVVVAGNSGFTISSSTTLVSDTFTASTTPTTARIVVFGELPDGLSDFSVSATRDNTTFNNITLTDEGYQTGSSGIKVFSGSTPLTGTASPQVQVRWKIVGSSLTSENKIHGVSLQWK
tara:strand:+ start:189 stop:1958 length:1770 start_codon:yes stop_codon:yes gene_type:complete